MSSFDFELSECAVSLFAKGAAQSDIEESNAEKSRLL